MIFVSAKKKFVFFFLTEKGVCCLFVVYLHPAALHQRLHIVNIVTTSSYVSLAQLSCHTFLLMFFLFLFFKFVVCEMPLIWISKETTGRYSSRRWHSSNTPTISPKNELIFVVFSFFLFNFSFECFFVEKKRESKKNVSIHPFFSCCPVESCVISAIAGLIRVEMMTSIYRPMSLLPILYRSRSFFSNTCRKRCSAHGQMYDTWPSSLDRYYTSE
jgi:hypothetical protein